MEKPEPGGMFRHFTGSVYRVVCLAHQTETGVNLVIVHAVPQQGLSNLAIPVDVFTGKFKEGGKLVPRFTKVTQH